MAWFLFAFKMIVVLGLLVFGGWLLLSNTGVISSIEVKGIKAHDLPIGLACIGAGVALAIFWKVSVKRDPGGGGGGLYQAVLGPIKDD